MEQLIKITTKSYEAVRISQGGKILPNDRIDAERRRALRQSLLQAERAEVPGSGYQHQVNLNYRRAHSAAELRSALQKAQPDTAAIEYSPSTAQTAAEPVNLYTESNMQDAGVRAARSLEDMASQQSTLSRESNASYYQELGALEMKVQTGAVSFLPPLSMTIVTQRPEFHIEYTGEFHYFPEPESTGEQLNLSS